MGKMNNFRQFFEDNIKNNRVGYCEFFDEKPFLHAANILVAADEPMRALQILENLPGYYRDNPPEAVLKTKMQIKKQLATPAFYMTNKYDALVRAEDAESVVDTTLRGQKILADIKDFNAKNLTPHIVDLGPGEYWLPIGLWKKRALFSYQDVGLCVEAKQKAMPHIKSFAVSECPTDRPVVFIACELIEHLHNEEDILTDCLRVCNKMPDIIHISTPLYTYDGQQMHLEWTQKGDLGHLRTYTPKEFYETVTKMFAGYKFELTIGPIMHMRGEKI